MPRLVAPAVSVVLLLGVGTAWAGTRADGNPADNAEVVTVSRGAVARTVGGVGRVATLTDAARLATPVAGTAAAANVSEALFAPVAGHVQALFVKVGDKVRAGQRIAEISDDGTAATAVMQARHELATAELELTQRRTQDPAHGLPPTAAELAFARQSLAAARDQLTRMTGDPLASDLAAARQDLTRAQADLEAAVTGRDSHPAAIAAAEQAVDAATQRLKLVTGSPDPADLATARFEVAQAQLELERLLTAAAGASAAEIAANDAAQAAAQARLAAAQTANIAADIATAQSDLARARADREALNQLAAGATASAQAAARLAVDMAQRKLNRLLNPTSDTVSTARAELSKAQAELAALRNTGHKSAAAAQAAVSAAQSRLANLLNPAPEVISAVRTDVARAAADLAILEQRGAPASEVDLALARLRVRVAEEKLRLTRQLADRLVVRAPAAGTVTSILTARGAAVDSTAPLVRVQDLDSLVVNVALTEFDVTRTQVGAVTRISADALGGRTYSGRVLDVGLSGTDSGGVVTFPVIVSIDEPRGLRPGMSVSARVVVASADDVVRIPLDAIQDRKGSAATVTVRTGSGTLEERDVQLGVVGTNFAEVRSGLSSGDKVVIPGGDAA